MKPRWWRRPVTWVAVAIVAVLVVFLRRWIHHAQLESIPVIVPDDVSAAEIVSPPPAAIARKMLLEVQETLKPPVRPRLAVLTFDDGPFPVTTPLLIAQLQALHVPAMFFLIGRDAASQPAIALRAKAAGIEIGNHTDTHPVAMGSLDSAVQRREIATGAARLAELLGERPHFFRPPHGDFGAATIEAARAERQAMVLWDVDPGDWRSIPPEQIVANVMQHARSPAVILLHNGRQATIEALPDIVRAYRDAGFEFITLEELERRLPLDAINDPTRVVLEKI